MLGPAQTGSEPFSLDATVYSAFNSDMHMKN